MNAVKPNLFVIGAAKSGTTSLHHHLARHPDILMSEPKEPGYFAEGLDYYPTEEEWYLGLFENGENLRYRGESSTHYTKLPVYQGVAERIAAFCDEPRFIYLMRDPIDRAISHYWHNTRQSAEFRPPLKAVENNLEYKAYGEYWRQLEPYFDRFSEDQIFVTTFEQLIESPGEVTSEIFSWLGLTQPASETFPNENSTPATIQRLRLGQRLGEFLHDSSTWNALSPLVPQVVKDVGKQIATEAVSPTDRSMNDVVEYLRPWARDVVARTSNYLAREFPEWTTTLGEY